MVHNSEAGQVLKGFVNAVQEAAIQISNGILQGSVLGTVLFNGLVKDLDVGFENILSYSADSTKSLKGREVFQRDFDKLEKWAITKHVKYNKSQILHLQQGNAEYLEGMRSWRAASKKGSGGSN